MSLFFFGSLNSFACRQFGVIFNKFKWFLVQCVISFYQFKPDSILVYEMFYQVILDPHSSTKMSISESSSSSSFADVVKQSAQTVRVVKTVIKVTKVEKYSPVKASRVRSIICSTPTFKRKRQEIESFSPVECPEDRSQRVINEVLSQQQLRYTVRKRKTNTVNICRRKNAASKLAPAVSSISTQTLEEENALIQKYIDEVDQLQQSRREMSYLFQLEKEKSSVLRSAVLSVLDRAEISIEDFEARTFNLTQTLVASENPDLMSESGLKNYHDQITRGINIKTKIHKGLLSSLKSIRRDCEATFVDLKQRHKDATKKKHPWSAKTNSCKTISQSSSDRSQCSILNNKSVVSKRVPFNPDAKFLRPPRSVNFKIPLEQYLNQSDQKVSDLSIEISNENIEIEIPATSEPVKVVIKSEVDTTKNVSIPENMNLSLLNISQSSTSLEEYKSGIDQLEQEWNDFACSSKINEDDVGSLYDYDSPSPEPAQIKQEAADLDEMPDN